MTKRNIITISLLVYFLPSSNISFFICFSFSSIFSLCFFHFFPFSHVFFSFIYCFAFQCFFSPSHYLFIFFSIYYIKTKKSKLIMKNLHGRGKPQGTSRHEKVTPVWPADQEQTQDSFPFKDLLICIKLAIYFFLRP